jgi:CubicO group peptidase (beta-lactamase class C family)
LRAILKAALVLVLFCAGQFSVAAPANSPVNAEIDAIVAPLAVPNGPGFAVLVRKDGRNIFERGCGVRDFRTLAKIDAATDFRLASFTKQFTAMTIMLLVRDGKLRYDDTLTDLFPGFPAYGRNITVRHLLTHASGLRDYEDLMAEVEKAREPLWSAARQIRDEEVLGLLKQQSSGKFLSGASWAYSNSGYVVLGLVAAKVSGKPFEQVLHDRIFEPLNMRRTVAYVNGKNSVPHRAYGHTKQGGQFIETDQSSTSATLGDGGIYSDLADLAKWDEACKITRC